MTFILDNQTVFLIIRAFLFQYASTIYPQHHSTPDIKLGVLVFSRSRGSSFISHLHYLLHTTKYFPQKRNVLSVFFPTLLKYPTVTISNQENNSWPFLA